MLIEVLTFILILLQLAYFGVFTINVIVDNKVTNILMVMVSCVLAILGMIILIQSKINNGALFADEFYKAIVLAVLLWNVVSAIVSSLILADELIKRQDKPKEA